MCVIGEEGGGGGGERRRKRRTSIDKDEVSSIEAEKLDKKRELTQLSEINNFKLKFNSLCFLYYGEVRSIEPIYNRIYSNLNLYKSVNMSTERIEGESNGLSQSEKEWCQRVYDLLIKDPKLAQEGILLGGLNILIDRGSMKSKMMDTLVKDNRFIVSKGQQLGTETVYLKSMHSSVSSAISPQPKKQDLFTELTDVNKTTNANKWKEADGGIKKESGSNNISGKGTSPLTRIESVTSPDTDRLQRIYAFLVADPLHLSNGVLLTHIGDKVPRGLSSKKMKPLLLSDDRFIIPPGQQSGSERVYLNLKSNFQSPVFNTSHPLEVDQKSTEWLDSTYMYLKSHQSFGNGGISINIPYDSNTSKKLANLQHDPRFKVEIKISLNSSAPPSLHSSLMNQRSLTASRISSPTSKMEEEDQKREWNQRWKKAELLLQMDEMHAEEHNRKVEAAAIARKGAEEEEAAIARTRAEEEEAAIACKKAEEEEAAIARTRAEEEEAAIARTRAEEEEAAIARTRAEEKEAAIARKKAEEEAATIARKKAEEAATIARKKAEEEAAIARKWADKEAGAFLRAEDRAAVARKRAEEEAANARKRADKEAAIARNRADKEAVAHKRAKEDEAIARKKAKDEAAIARKREEDEAAIARKKAKEDAAIIRKRFEEEAAIARKKAKDEAAITRKREEDEVAIARKCAEEAAITRKRELEDAIMNTAKSAVGADAQTSSTVDIDQFIKSSKLTALSLNSAIVPTDDVELIATHINLFRMATWLLREKSAKKFWKVGEIDPRLSIILLKCTEDNNPHLQLKYDIHESSFTLRWAEPLEGNGSLQAKIAVENAVIILKYACAEIMEIKRLQEEERVKKQAEKLQMQLENAKIQAAEKAKEDEREAKEKIEADALSKKIASLKSSHLNNCQGKCSNNTLRLPEIHSPKTLRDKIFQKFVLEQVHREFLEWIEINSSLIDKLTTVKVSSKLLQQNPSVKDYVRRHLKEESDRVLARCERLCIFYEGIQVYFSRFGCCVIHVAYDKELPNDFSIVNSGQFLVDDALRNAYKAGDLSREESQKLQAALSKGHCKLMKLSTLQLVTLDFTSIFDNLGEKLYKSLRNTNFIPRNNTR
jgi:hypothetical protein